MACLLTHQQLLVLVGAVQRSATILPNQGVIRQFMIAG
jgi:hypothetical protein